MSIPTETLLKLIRTIGVLESLVEELENDAEDTLDRLEREQNRVSELEQELESRKEVA